MLHSILEKLFIIVSKFELYNLKDHIDNIFFKFPDKIKIFIKFKIV